MFVGVNIWQEVIVFVEVVCSVFWVEYYGGVEEIEENDYCCVYDQEGQRVYLYVSDESVQYVVGCLCVKVGQCLWYEQ